MADKKMVEKNQKNEAEKAADVTANDTNKKAAPVKAEESGKANTKGVDVEQKEIIKGIEAVGSVAGSAIDATTGTANLGGQVASKTTEVLKGTVNKLISNMGITQPLLIYSVLFMGLMYLGYQVVSEGEEYGMPINGIATLLNFIVLYLHANNSIMFQKSNTKMFITMSSIMKTLLQMYILNQEYDAASFGMTALSLFATTLIMARHKETINSTLKNITQPFNSALGDVTENPITCYNEKEIAANLPNLANAFSAPTMLCLNNNVKASEIDNKLFRLPDNLGDYNSVKNQFSEFLADQDEEKKEAELLKKQEEEEDKEDLDEEDAAKEKKEKEEEEKKDEEKKENEKEEENKEEDKNKKEKFNNKFNGFKTLVQKNINNKKVRFSL